MVWAARVDGYERLTTPMAVGEMPVENTFTSEFFLAASLRYFLSFKDELSWRP